MLEDAENGMSQEQLAEKYQICVSTVRYSLKDFYEEQARQRKAKKKAWQTQMIHEYEMGAKSPELQEKYGISGTLFYRILHAHGKNGRQIHSQNRIETGKKRNAEMVRKYKNGVSVKELAEEYGLKKGSVYRAMKRYNPGPGKSKSCQSEE
jgi:Mor family transcriptional regulator